uniref:Uncharacterized protein n=1 Tax=Arundo donax TaxID=35708 RepID=A0A0A8YEZ6_ARUDO
MTLSQDTYKQPQICCTQLKKIERVIQRCNTLSCMYAISAL